MTDLIYYTSLKCTDCGHLAPEWHFHDEGLCPVCDGSARVYRTSNRVSVTPKLGQQIRDCVDQLWS